MAEKSMIERISEAFKAAPDPRVFQPIQPDLTWPDVEQYMTGTGRYKFLGDRGGAAGGDDIDALIEAALAAGGLGGAGGGGYGGGAGAGAIPWGSTEGAARLAQQFALEQMMKEQAYRTEQERVGRQFEAGEAEKQREFQRLQELEELKAERQRIFAEMMGTDPVRAALFAMGVGGEILPGGERFASLPPLPGAKTYGKQAASALSELTGRQIGVGEQGVTGLPGVHKMATAFSAGRLPGGKGLSREELDAARTMLLSGIGVGAKRGAGLPGLSPEAAMQGIKSVTPTGVFGQ